MQGKFPGVWRTDLSAVLMLGTFAHLLRPEQANAAQAMLAHGSVQRGHPLLRSAAPGYSPACAHEWVPVICEKQRIKCSECPHQRFRNAELETFFGRRSLSNRSTRLFAVAKVHPTGEIHSRARYLDYFAYGRDVISRSLKLSEAIIAAVGDREGEDVAEST